MNMLSKFVFILCVLILSSTSYASKQHKIPSNTPTTNIQQSYLIADNIGNILNEENSNMRRPIASITKLMVGLLSINEDLDEHLEIPSTRNVQSSIPHNQKTLTRKELLKLSLVRSDNFASQILCANIPDCINEMNRKALELGMINTIFIEPTGLSKENISTASDLLKLIIEVSKYKLLAEVSSMPNAEIFTGKNIIKVNNTNPLTRKLNITLSKTGFTNPAGQCLVMVVESPVGQRFMVLLGSKNRIADMENLYKKFVAAN